jgi:two-component system nitrate/nitrite response regulator NarL
MEDRLRILLVDDHVLFRRGVQALLVQRPGVEVVGEASNGLEAVTRARETMPDVILMDIHMPLCDGLEAVGLIKREMPHVQIIMLTVSDDDRDLFAAIKNGASGYLLKNLEPQHLFEQLDGVRRGEAAINGMMAARILQEFREPALPATPESEPVEMLTPREIDVLQQVVQGASNRQIAQDLCITENTVKIHLRNILEKLHLQNRIQAAVYAVRTGLVDEV